MKKVIQIAGRELNSSNYISSKEPLFKREHFASNNAFKAVKRFLSNNKYLSKNDKIFILTNDASPADIHYFNNEMNNVQGRLNKFRKVEIKEDTELKENELSLYMLRSTNYQLDREEFALIGKSKTIEKYIHNYQHEIN